MTGFDDYLARLLNSRIFITNAETRRFEGPFSTKSQVIKTNRFICVLQGSLFYQVADKEADIKKGTIIYVPATVHRVWRVAPQKSCTLIWNEFTTPAVETRWDKLVINDAINLPLEKTSFQRVLDLFESKKHSKTSRRLVIEGEIKAILGRFFSTLDFNQPHVAQGNLQPQLGEKAS
ncbi:MAG: hypothetical protein AAF558_14970, partial [Verrucomicrobiota bacterium]